MQKMKITRPQFLVKLFAGEITEDALEQVLPYHYKKVYGCYSMLKPYDFDHSDLLAATVDTEDGSITLKMRNTSLVKNLKAAHHKTTICVGNSEYLVTLKPRGKFVTINMNQLNDDELDKIEE